MNPKNFQPIGKKQTSSRAIAKAIRFPHPWAATVAERQAQYCEWRSFAMQILHRNGGHFRIVAIMDEMFVPTGECWATDEEFSRSAGGCSTKTASRDLGELRRLGLVVTEPGWVEKAGKRVKGRRLWLSVPLDINGLHVR